MKRAGPSLRWLLHGLLHDLSSVKGGRRAVGEHKGLEMHTVSGLFMKTVWP